MQNKSFQCAICRNCNFEFLYKVYNYNCFDLESFSILRSRNCGGVRLNFLSEKKYDYLPVDLQSPLNKKDTWHKFLTPHRAKLIEQFKKKGRILDIGCGNGDFLIEMKKCGWEVAGNETTKGMVDYVRRKFRMEAFILVIYWL